jgi:hypothetical protein
VSERLRSVVERLDHDLAPDAKVFSVFDPP